MLLVARYTSPLLSMIHAAARLSRNSGLPKQFDDDVTARLKRGPHVRTLRIDGRVASGAGRGFHHVHGGHIAARRRDLNVRPHAFASAKKLVNPLHLQAIEAALDVEIEARERKDQPD